MVNRRFAVPIDAATRERLERLREHARRLSGGRPSFAGVAAGAIAAGLDVLEQNAPPMAIANAPEVTA